MEIKKCKNCGDPTFKRFCGTCVHAFSQPKIEAVESEKKTEDSLDSGEEKSEEKIEGGEI